MSADEFQQLWRAYDAKLQRSLLLNQQLLEEVRSVKVKGSFSRFATARVVSIIVGVLWMMILAVLIRHFRSEPVFVACAGIVMLITVISIAGYIYQVVIVRQINFEKTIVETQEELARLEAVIIRTHRIGVLQLPFYSCFQLSRGMMAGMGPTAWVIQIVITLFFIYVTYRIYRAVNLRNVGKSWMTKMMKHEGFSSIAKARAFLEQIKEFRRENL